MTKPPGQPPKLLRDLAAQYALRFLDHPWFDSALVRPTEGPTLAMLLIRIYHEYLRGHLISKTDAGHAIASEHKATTNKYIQLGVDIKAITIESSTLDQRIKLLVPTRSGLRLVESELDAIVKGWLSLRPWLEGLPDEPLFPPLDDPYLNRVMARTSSQTTLDFNRRTHKGTLAFAAATKLVARRGHVDDSTKIGRDIFSAVHSEILRFFPTHEYAHNSLYFNAMLGRRFSDALVHAEHLLTIDPRSLHYRALRADALKSLGDYKRALEDINIVIKEEPTNDDALIIRARTQAAAGALTDAINDYSTLAKRQDGRAELYTIYLPERAKCYEQLGQSKRAIADLTRALALTLKDEALADTDDAEILDAQIRIIKMKST